MIRIHYQAASGEDPVVKTARDLEAEFAKKSEEFEKLDEAGRTHYLSPKVLSERDIGEAAAKRLAEDCITMERLKNDDVKDNSARLPGISEDIVKLAKGVVTGLLDELKEVGTLRNVLLSSMHSIGKIKPLLKRG